MSSRGRFSGEGSYPRKPHKENPEDEGWWKSKKELAAKIKEMDKLIREAGKKYKEFMTISSDSEDEMNDISQFFQQPRNYDQPVFSETVKGIIMASNDQELKDFVLQGNRRRRPVPVIARQTMDARLPSPERDPLLLETQQQELGASPGLAAPPGLVAFPGLGASPGLAAAPGLAAHLELDQIDGAIAPPIVSDRVLRPRVQRPVVITVPTRRRRRRRPRPRASSPHPTQENFPPSIPDIQEEAVAAQHQEEAVAAQHQEEAAAAQHQEEAAAAQPSLSSSHEEDERINTRQALREMERKCRQYRSRPPSKSEWRESNSRIKFLRKELKNKLRIEGLSEEVLESAPRNYTETVHFAQILNDYLNKESLLESEDEEVDD